MLCARSIKPFEGGRTVCGRRGRYICSKMPSKFKTVAVWLLSVLLFVAFAWSLNLTLFNWWASGGPPVQHPEIYRHRGNVFCGISFVLFLNFIVAAWVLARRRKRGPSARRQARILRVLPEPTDQTHSIAI